MIDSAPVCKAAVADGAVLLPAQVVEGVVLQDRMVRQVVVTEVKTEVDRLNPTCRLQSLGLQGPHRAEKLTAMILTLPVVVLRRPLHTNTAVETTGSVLEAQDEDHTTYIVPTF